MVLEEPQRHRVTEAGTNASHDFAFPRIPKRQASERRGTARHASVSVPLWLCITDNSFDLDNVVQFAELIRLDVLVVRVGLPLAVDDEAIAVSAGAQR